MFARSRLRRLQEPQGAKAFVAVAAAIVACFMIVTTATAQACSRRSDANVAAVATYAMNAEAAVLAAPTGSGIDSAYGKCCGGTLDSIGSGCSTACCSACSAALPAPMLDVGPRANPRSHALPPDGGLTFASPDADFRPPRLFA